MEHDTIFVELLLITSLAVIVPVVISRIPKVRVPIVVGEILAGMLIGRSGLNLVQPAPTLTFLADFGFVFLMFLSGLEVDFGLLLKSKHEAGRTHRWTEPIPLGFIFFALTLIMAIGVGYGLLRLELTENPVLIGIILSTTSLSIVMPILKEQGLAASPYGQTVLVAALVSDFGSLLLMSIAVVVVSTGFSIDMLLFLLLLGAFMTAMQVVRWVNRIPWLPGFVEDLSHATAQIRVRVSFALMVIWVVLAEFLGVEIILGAFLAGAILSLSSRNETPLRDKLDAIGYGFFVPVFFITVGANFNLKALLVSKTALLLVPLLAVAAYLLKVLPSLIYRVRFSWPLTWAAGALLSSRLSLIIAVSTIALKLGLISDAVNAAIILVAIVTCTLSPLAFLSLLPAGIAQKRSGVIIAGADRLSLLLGHRLKKGIEPVVFVGRGARRSRSGGFRAVEGDPRDEYVLPQAGAETARALVVVYPQSDMVFHLCVRARELFAIPSIVACTEDPRVIEELRSRNMAVIQPSTAVALALEGALHFPAA
jgi:Kef-type K+ transport system membrane component KefB